MGLCKCPKRKVTNLFCFEHRVNVCEHCLVANHPKCIVQSYLQWLQDSDYNPVCTLCQRSLADEDAGNCVRLLCYDVFHWSCLNAYAQQLPANTAPAGYQCPACKTGIFPANNIASPVADALRTLLSEVNWARAGLGLPLIEEPSLPPLPPPPVVSQSPEQSLPSQSNGISQSLPAQNHIQADGFIGQSYTAGHTSYPTPISSKVDTRQYQGHSAMPKPTMHSVVNVDDMPPYSREKANPRRLFEGTNDMDLLNMSKDHDEDKYKRRPALHWLSKWFKSREGKNRKDPSSTYKKFLVVLVIGLLGFITVILIFSKMGKAASDEDPFLDPMANPNIRVNEGE
ncbi:zinc finger protein-like 1 homolog isoform X2 [Lingula anatina]|uniref:Zinc finger protein-like 1 homolog isoform X2 n=1 Tax=Lingula anatina TaxID=7574 RepID=A0A1S3ILK3_LINAN|nr:zinc finger protein-like 1 homolog isoform X2 [Lingula anatina]|eukprot:XP_013398399.1 zinc finger protein-like 1 homolog isoform X2 [Lingula anatina]